LADSASHVTHLLEAWRKGDPSASAELMSLVYDELHRMAERHLARERSDHSLQATALVNEVYIRVIGQRDARYNDRIHFLAIAAQMMRRLLVDHARRRLGGKRGGNLERVSLVEGAAAVDPATAIDVLALHNALRRLAAVDPRKSRLVELRYFGGLNVEETAQVLGIAKITVKREWATAKLWLRRQMQGL